MTETAVKAKLGAIDVERIMQMIPHRYPFLMIDKVIEMVPDQYAIGVKNVSINEMHFMGHFPSKPVMPGVLLIEAMAQTSAVLVVETLGTAFEGNLVYFMSIDNARFRKPVVPGDSVHIRAQKEKSRGNVWRFACTATVDGAKVAEAVVCAMILAGEPGS
jgi:3-hydroxyacyl-[acyl-carrier-protein] dehydratase